MQLIGYKVMWTLAIIVVLVLTIVACCWGRVWRDSIGCAKGMFGTNKCIRIRFKEFIHLYAALPDNFYLSRDRCICHFSNGYEDKEYHITFSFLDFIRYRIWYKSLAATDKRKRELSIKTDFCKDMRKAIFEINKDIEKEIEDCARQFKDITKRDF